jgi:LuxR family maltose regulon positive regulatory protein
MGTPEAQRPQGDCSRQRDRGPVAAGSPSYLAYLLGEMKVRPETVSPPVVSRPGGIVEALTAREGEIVRLIAAEMRRNQEIADHLFISLHTLKRHIANAYGKLGVSHRTEAVARGREVGLVTIS